MNRRTGAIVALVVAIATTVAVIATTATATPNRAAEPASAGKALVRCGKSVTIGLAAPFTGPAASLGQPQVHWANFFRTRWNSTHKLKINFVDGDTQLPDVAQATKVAQTFASTSSMLGVVGPAGSQEVVASTPIFKGAGLGFVSGSATRTTLTDGSRRGYFFRVVPTDAQQGPTVATYAAKKLKVKKVFIIDDQETYSTGLASDATTAFRALGVTVERDSVSQSASDFSSLISKIGSDVNAVYIPWQLPPKAQLFAQQMREQGKRQIMLSSDGTFDPSTYKPGQTAYVSFFPVDTKGAVIKAYKRTHGGLPEFFGAPTYVAAQVVATAVSKACANGTASRAEVRQILARTNLPKTLLGFRTKFTASGALASPGKFGIYRATNGNYVRVG
jgi:ABC-type branched-subunit amino acid transport system substrate-binding protein